MLRRACRQVSYSGRRIYWWFARLLGKPLGFALFLLNFINYFLSTAVIALGAGEYLKVVFPHIHGMWIGFALCICSAIIGLFSIRSNAFFTSIFLIIELAAILIIVWLGFIHPVNGISEFFHIRNLDVHKNIIPGHFTDLVMYLSVAFFAFNGFGSSIYYIEETKNATKNIGKIIIICLITTVIIEILPVIATIMSTPSMAKLMNSDHPFNYLLLFRGNTFLNKTVSLGIAIAVINAVIANVLQNARLLFSSARDQYWPRYFNTIFTTVSKRTYTPIFATLCVGLITGIITIIVPLELLITATSSGIVLLYLFVAISALTMKRKQVIPGRKYRIALWALPAIIVICMTLYIGYQSLQTSPTPLLIALSILFIGLAYYFSYLHRHQGNRWTLLEPISEKMER